jgi:integrase
VSQSQKESLELFLESIKSTETRRVYSVYLGKYAEQYSLKETDPGKIASMIIDFIISLKKEKSHFAIRNYVSAVLAYYKINDIILNTTKINKFMPSATKVRKDRAYTYDEISKLLSIADERMKVIILLMASSGIRIGAIQSIRLRNIEEKEMKLTVYENDREEYFTFITPECKKAIDNYLDMRLRYNEKLNDESYLIREQFDVKNPGKPREVKTLTIERRLIDMKMRLGMRNNQVPVAHGFRKFFTTQLINSKVNPEIREMLLGHKIGLASAYYRPTVEEMYEEYQKAIDNLTIDPNQRLRKKIETLQVEKSLIEDMNARLQELERRRD